jgi:hypothetical protein
MELRAAMSAIRKDDAKGRAFLNDPAGTLKSMGVDTSNLNIKKTGAASAAGVTHDACVSAGCGICATVG